MKITKLFDQNVDDRRSPEGMMSPLAVIRVDWENQTSTVFISNPHNEESLFWHIDEIGDPNSTEGITILDITSLNGLIIDSSIVEEDGKKVLEYNTPLYELPAAASFYEFEKTFN